MALSPAETHALLALMRAVDRLLANVPASPSVSEDREHLERASERLHREGRKTR